MENFRDLSQLVKDREFKNLTVEQAIRLMGEKEKANIIGEREKLLQNFGKRLDDAVTAIKSGR